MDFQYTTIISYAGPPLLGAFIGYLTNKIAIRMLFRPLRAWHIWGIRVPMTPGVIPSKRHELAENIGEMVGDHLLTANDIGGALSTERFQDHLFMLVDERVQTALTKDLGPVATIVPQRFKAYLKVGLRTVKYQLRQGLHTYIGSDSFAKAVRNALLEQLTFLGEKELDSLVTADQRNDFYATVDRFIATFLAGSDVEKWLASYLETSLGTAAAQGKTVADILPKEFQDLIVEIIQRQAPLVLQHLAVILAEPTMRERIIKAICDGVDHFLETLGPMGAMARGFFDLETLQEKIRCYLEDKEDDLARWLQKDDVQQRVADALTRQTQKYLETPLYQLLVKLDTERQKSLCRQASEQISSVLRSEGVSKALSFMVRNQCEEMLDNGHITLADLRGLLLPGANEEKLTTNLTSQLISLLRSDMFRRRLDAMLTRMVDKQAARPVGILQDLLPAGVHKSITDFIVTSANRMLLKEVPGLVDSLNIKVMVTEKVDSLDLLRLERLLLSIMEEQFRYINLFGALLGFLIGLINLLVLGVL